MERGTGLDKGRLIRVEKLHFLLAGCLLAGGLYGLYPFSSLNVIDQPVSLLKDSLFLRTHALDKHIISDQNVRNHLMHVVGIIFADIPVAVIGKCHLIIFGSIDNIGLESRVHVTKTHGCGGASQKTHHLNVGGRLLDPDF